MTQFTPGMIIESLLILLLVLTVSYCMILNRRLSRLRSSQHELREIIGDLCTATQTAENAILGLKATTEEADLRLSDKLHSAQLLTRELSNLTSGRIDTQLPAAAAMAAQNVAPAPAPFHARALVAEAQIDQPAVAPAAPAIRPVPPAPARAPMPSMASARAANGAFAAPDHNDWRHRTMSRLTNAR